MREHASYEPRLRDLWERVMRDRSKTLGGEMEAPDWASDISLLRELGIGLHETLAYLYAEAPSYDGFESWVRAHNGGELHNAAADGEQTVLSEDDLAFFDEHGYVVVHNAVTASACREAENAIWTFLDMDPDRPESWYTRPNGHSIWVPLLHHEAVWANRRAPRVRGAFAQLWGRDDLLCSVDQCGFNPPVRDDWPFPGPRLHFDCRLETPVPFGLQGILYLTDTAAHQGAFTCVPGFQHQIDAWLAQMLPKSEPCDFDLYALGPRPIAGWAGDLIIWHHALPHGSSPNTADRPRIVQYITYDPA